MFESKLNLSSERCIDACVFRLPDGTWRMYYNNEIDRKSIYYTDSPDLYKWTDSRKKVVGDQGGEGPNVFHWKGKNWMLVDNWNILMRDPCIIKGANNLFHMVWTVSWNDKGFNVIDATIQPSDNGYMMFLKDETLNPVAQKNLHVAFSKHLTEGYSAPSGAITGKYWAEGPTAIKIDNEWIVYFDKYTQGKYGAVSSMDLKVWKDISDKISFPKGIRHGTVFSIPENDFKTWFRQ